MDIKHLVYFITLAEERNMTKAAEKLYISQSTLSYILSKLETELGKPLFLRAKKEMVLTPAGQLYLASARQVVSIRQELYKTISELENETTIKISTTSLWGTRMLADIIPLFNKTFPKVVFQLSQIELTPLTNAVLDGTLDFGLISVSSMDNFNETAELLRKEELFLAVPNTHPYVLEHPGNDITADDLIHFFSNDSFLLSPKGTANRELADSLFAKYDTAPALIYEVSGLPLTCQMVSQGIGLSFIPLSGKSLENMIHYYSFVPKLYRYNVLIHRKDLTLSPPVQTFIDYAKVYFNS